MMDTLLFLKFVCGNWVAAMNNHRFCTRINVLRHFRWLGISWVNVPETTSEHKLCKKLRRDAYKQCDQLNVMVWIIS